MRGIYTPVTDIRRKVFTEVARMAYNANELSDYAQLMRELPFKIIPGEEKSLRSSIFLERAIVSERIRLAMGFSLRPLDESVPATEGLEHGIIADKYYEPPLINVIKFACNGCPEKVIKVTEMCQGCLAHPCQEVCPKHAISFRNGKSQRSTRVHVCEVRPLRGHAAPTAPSSRPSVPVPLPAAWAPSTRMNTVVPRSITISAYPAACALSTAPSAPSSDKGQIFQLIQSIRQRRRSYRYRGPRFRQPVPRHDPCQAEGSHAPAGLCRCGRGRHRR